MATLSIQKPTLAGLAPTYAAAAGGGDQFPNDGATILHVKNGSGGALTVTVDSKTPSNYGTDVDVTVSVPAAGERMIGPFPKARFDDVNGNVQVTYSGVTSLTVAALSGV